MADYVFLVPVEPGACIASPAEFSAMVANAQFVPTVGATIVGATAPDVVTYPALKRFIWIDTSVNPPLLSVWQESSSSWIAQELEAGSVTGDMIADGAITLSKMSIAGASANYVVRINSSGTGWIFDDVANLFSTSNRLDVNKLSLSAVGAYVLSCNGTTVTWTLLSTLIGALTFTISQIVNTGALDKQVISFFGAANAWKYVEDLLRDGQIALTKLAPGAANTLLGTNAGGTAIESKTLASVGALLSPNIIKRFASAQIVIPAAAGAIGPVAHGFPGAPSFYEWFLVCVTAEYGYAATDRIPIDRLYTVMGAGDDRTAPFTTTDDASNLYLRADSGSYDIGALDKSNGDPVNLTPGNWRLVASAMYIY